jgi:hypothetical protein
MLQPKAGYIVARPLTANSRKFSCNARPDHTFGSDSDIRLNSDQVRFSRKSRHQTAIVKCRLCANSGNVEPVLGAFELSLTQTNWEIEDPLTEFIVCVRAKQRPLSPRKNYRTTRKRLAPRR